MKFCTKCGAQIPSNSQTCPQCENSSGEITSSISSEEPTPKKKSSKLKIIIPLFTITVVVVVAGFVVWSLLKPDPTSELCPNQYNKYHDWLPATCIEPAKCSECGRYKDDKLASHHNWSTKGSSTAYCVDCNLYRKDYLEKQEKGSDKQEKDLDLHEIFNTTYYPQHH